MKNKEKRLRLKNEKRNLKNKKRELRRKKEFQHNQEKKCLKKLWSIPQPKEYTFEGRGYLNLYHYTFGDNISSILKYGIIFGDVMTDYLDGFNSPNLTTENHFHSPSNTPVSHHEKRDKLYRLNIKCPTNSNKLINYGWFDRTYCKGINFKQTSTNPSFLGDLDKQYIYLGHIDPSMITGIKGWNKQTKCWERFRRQEKEDLCQEYESLKFKHKSIFPFPDFVRICGYRSNDYTGMVKKYYEETDHKDVWKDLYVLSDYIIDQGFNDHGYKIRVLQQVMGGVSYIESGRIVSIVIETYNRVVSVSKRIDPEKFSYRLNKTIEEYVTWMDEVNEKPTEEYQENLRMVS
jgi:hypothetical protein